MTMPSSAVTPAFTAPAPVATAKRPSVVVISKRKRPAASIQPVMALCRSTSTPWPPSSMVRSTASPKLSSP